MNAEERCGFVWYGPPAHQAHGKATNVRHECLLKRDHAKNVPHKSMDGSTTKGGR